jgi:hypothetical protein
VRYIEAVIVPQARQLKYTIPEIPT